MKNLLKATIILLVLFFAWRCTYDGFARKEVKLIADKPDNEVMRLFTIESYSDSLVLRKKAREVYKRHIGTKNMEQLRKRMLATVKDSTNLGVGIAAPQIGISMQMILVQRFDKVNEPMEVYYNPEITDYGDSINSGREGCLSVNGYWGEVDRSQNITITYLDSVGNSQEEKINGFTAVIFQHETDHLKGILYFDHLYNGFQSLTEIEEE